MTDEILLDAVDVYKSYKTGSTQIEALKHVSLRVKKGEFVSIVGPSGSGKSTLLNALGGISRPTSGSIIIDGCDICSKPYSEKTHELRLTKMGFIFQFFNLIPTLTALENVMLPMEFMNIEKTERENRAKELLSLVGLGKRIGHKPAQMSGGEQQRVTIARALANKPPLILGDEPTGNLDSRTGTEIIKLLRSLNKEQGYTFVIVTHDLRVARAADRVIYVRDGKIVQEKVVENN